MIIDMLAPTGSKIRSSRPNYIFTVKHEMLSGRDTNVIVLLELVIICTIICVAILFLAAVVLFQAAGSARPTVFFAWATEKIYDVGRALPDITLHIFPYY